MYARKKYSEGLNYLINRVDPEKLENDGLYLKLIGYLKTKDMKNVFKTAIILYNQTYMNLEFLNTMGDIYWEKGDLQKSKLFYKRSLDVHPDQVKVKERLTQIK